MTGQPKPKFNVGDIVVIHSFGTVGKITNLKWIDSYYVYEVNNSEGLYLENSLLHINEFEQNPPTSETIEIGFQYEFGDLVKVSGYGEDIYKVIGKRIEAWRYKNDSWEDVVYELTRLKDGEWLEANEDDLILVVTAEQAQTYLKKTKLSKGAFAKLDAEKLKSIHDYKKLGMNPDRQKIIDGLLDVYNDYKELYDLFQDAEYKTVLDIVVKNLKKLSEVKK